MRQLLITIFCILLVTSVSARDLSGGGGGTVGDATSIGGVPLEAGSPSDDDIMVYDLTSDEWKYEANSGGSLPDQTDHAGQLLGTDGATADWTDTVTTLNITESLLVGNSASASIMEGSESGVTISVPLHMGDSDGFTIPTTDGTASQVMKTDGSGIVTWEDESGGGGTISTNVVTDNYNLPTIQNAAADFFGLTRINSFQATDVDSGGYLQGISANSGWMRDFNASVTVPSLGPDKGDTNTGIGHPTSDQLGLIAGGILVLKVRESGSVGFLSMELPTSNISGSEIYDLEVEIKGETFKIRLYK